VLNPCAEAFGQHLEVQSDGSVRAVTTRGAAQIALCRLNHPTLLEARRMMLELFTMLTASGKEEARALLPQLYSFPDHLPRLSNLRPPMAMHDPPPSSLATMSNASVVSFPRHTDRTLTLKRIRLPMSL